MTSLPAPVLDLLHRQAVDRRSPAYVRIDSDARVLGIGGNLSKYGLNDLVIGDAVDAQLPYLQGLLDSDESDPHLLTVEADTGVVADVFLARDNTGDLVVLLDATFELEQQKLIQQITNELRLLQAQVASEQQADDGSTAFELLAELGAAALEQVDVGILRMHGTPPRWFSEVWPQAVAESSRIEMQELSPFLDAFLDDAASTWRSGNGVLQSGPWTEVDSSGKEWHLEATALVCCDRAMLVIVDRGRWYEEMSGLLQRARDNSLAHQALLGEIEKKDVLLHSIVHDLLGPMVSAHSGFQLLETEPLSPRGSRTLNIGMGELERQERLIRSILDVFADDVSEMHQEEETLSTVDVLECARTVTDGFAAVYDLRSVKLHLDVASETAVSWIVAGDRMRLIRVFGNLVDNALRHSKVGSSVRISIEPEDGTVLVKVRDEGSGVPAEFTDRVFDRFTQAGSSRGTAGLGLHFCRITVEGWGGNIGFDNPPEGGACFWFRLRTAEP